MTETNLRLKIDSDIYKDVEDFKLSWKIIPGRGEIIFEVKVGVGDLSRGFVSILSVKKFVKIPDIYELKREDCYSLVQKAINFFMVFSGKTSNDLLIRTFISVPEYDDLSKSHLYVIEKDGDIWIIRDAKKI